MYLYRNSIWKIKCLHPSEINFFFLVILSLHIIIIIIKIYYHKDNRNMLNAYEAADLSVIQ